MNKYILGFLINFFSISAFAFVQLTPPKNIKMDLKFHYEIHNKNGAYQTVDTNTVLKMNTHKNDKWQWVSGRHSCDFIDDVNSTSHLDANDFLLFAKIVNITAYNASIKFMVLDWKSGKAHLYEPVIIAYYGKKSNLNLVEDNHNLRFDVLISKME